jgi:UDP-GlcNAc3NAcA epimerase
MTSPPTIVTVVGARPQFVKAAPVSRALVAVGAREILVHTGQHYDASMSDVFFQRLGIADPAHHLGVGSGNHGAQTARMLDGIERIVLDAKPDLMLVYGDTNSTLAGALAAAKLHVPVAHVEAGLRSFNRRMPEEVNRVLTDHVSSVLFAPTDAAVANLAAEGIRGAVVRTGDVMLDTAMLFREECGNEAGAQLAAWGVDPRKFILATIHRAENTDDPARWHSILEAMRRVGASVGTVIWPVHPRVRRALDGVSLENVRLLDPLPYFEMQALLMNARVVLTDSGGLQKEAAFHGTPCVTLRDETEWVELVSCGVNTLAGTDSLSIVRAAEEARWPAAGLPAGLYGDGKSADRIAEYLVRWLDRSGTPDS